MTDEQNAMNLLDATNSLSYILNVQLYLTLEKAKENVSVSQKFQFVFIAYNGDHRVDPEVIHVQIRVI